jgi:hypothetical protein
MKLTQTALLPELAQGAVLSNSPETADLCWEGFAENRLDSMEQSQNLSLTLIFSDSISAVPQAYRPQ